MSNRCKICWRVSEPPIRLRPAPLAPIMQPLNTEETPTQDAPRKTEWRCKICGAWQE